MRLIDVYPESYAKDRRMGGYQLLIAGERAAGPLPQELREARAGGARQVSRYTIDLHWSHHRFRKGHKIMVQVQSTWFPLIDRNPQKYVANIFEAKDADFQSAEQRVYRSAEFPTHVSLPVMKAGK